MTGSWKSKHFIKMDSVSCHLHLHWKHLCFHSSFLEPDWMSSTTWGGGRYLWEVEGTSGSLLFPPGLQSHLPKVSPWNIPTSWRESQSSKGQIHTRMQKHGAIQNELQKLWNLNHSLFYESAKTANFSSRWKLQIEENCLYHLVASPALLH